MHTYVQCLSIMPIFTEQIELQLTYNIHINTPIFRLFQLGIMFIYSIQLLQQNVLSNT